ncbi:response regulator [Thermanaerothrix sp. 4228-RoL]|jgi:CheY-like chemotaxis protein|uniref:Response regulator n=1 Tax=Thermanaerothrix solaris TaxID=3058434 RepID=A0ABU3NPP1_9CHLR|nr:response regulator [Thermanaerothrix sp. 4228-RoL]MDT8898814.1 response regulator [Thermanaerothrix sp. 4228-RoL]
MAARRVLIVEDTLELGRMLRSALLTLDPALEIHVVPSAEEALLDVSRQGADLMIADIRLPGMSGFDLVKKLHQRFPQTPCILITALTEEGLAQRAQEVGAVRFLRKPLSMNTFLDAVAEVLGMPTAPPPPADTASSTGEETPRLAARLGRLRQTLNAHAVFLLDDRGHIVAQAGEWLPAYFEHEWIPPLMAALSAGIKVSRLIRPGPPQGVTALKGAEVDLLFAPVGVFALVLVVPANESVVRLPLAFEAVLQAAQEVARILDEMGVGYLTVTTAPPPPELPLTLPPGVDAEVVPVEVLPVEATELQPLVESLEQPSLPADPQAIDAFWEAAVKDEAVSLLTPEALTYEEARRLGLAPDSEAEESTENDNE